MKEIKAFVRPKRLLEIVKHLRLGGFSSLSVFDGEGTGNYVDQEKTWPSLKHPFLHYEISKIEIVVHPSDVDRVVQIIHEYGKTGKRGDGIIYITEVTRALKVKDLSSNDFQNVSKK